MENVGNSIQVPAEIHLGLWEKCRFYHIKGTNVNVKKSNDKPQKEEKPQADIK
jgi:hypothetical protein